MSERPNSRARQKRKIRVVRDGVRVQTPVGRFSHLQGRTRSCRITNALNEPLPTLPHMRLAFLIPCHRVIRASGALGDYRWRPAGKQAIQARERIRVEADTG